MPGSSQKGGQVTIGTLASRAGVNVETIRYYQRIGLIKRPLKPAQGYRRYPTETVDLIRFIKNAQRLGFSLQEIAELIELGDRHCKDVRERATQQRNRIDQQIRDLQALRDTLDTLIDSCRRSNNKSCTIVRTLTRS